MVNHLKAGSKFEVVASQTEFVELPTTGEHVERELPFGAQISSTGLILPKALNDDEWWAVGLVLARLQTAAQWAIGDWWAYGHHTYGARAKAAVKDKKFPYSFESLMNLGSVSRKVPPSLRNELLTWSHHKEIAPLEEESQKRWLKKAARNNWRVKTLRKKIDEQQSDDRARDPVLWGGYQIDKLIDRAQRTYALLEWDDCPELDRASDKMIAELVEHVTVAADAWKKVADGAKAYQAARLAAGDNFKPRPVPEDNEDFLEEDAEPEPMLQAAE